jgi:hypothetical protein
LTHFQVPISNFKPFYFQFYSHSPKKKKHRKGGGVGRGLHDPLTLPSSYYYLTGTATDFHSTCLLLLLFSIMGAEIPQDGLKKLEYLSLVSKVCTELESHTGAGDKVLAEFITDLGHSSDSVEEFDAKLKENGAEMPDYFVRTLLTIIHAILPPKPKKEKEIHH